MGYYAQATTRLGALGSSACSVRIARSHCENGATPSPRRAFSAARGGAHSRGSSQSCVQLCFHHHGRWTRTNHHGIAFRPFLGAGRLDRAPSVASGFRARRVAREPQHLSNDPRPTITIMRTARSSDSRASAFRRRKGKDDQGRRGTRALGRAFLR